MQTFYLYVGSTNLVELSGLKDSISGAWLNAATVEFTLKTQAGVEVAGQVWPLTMTHVPNSKGIYRAAIPHDLTLTVGTTYIAEISATNDTNVGLWQLQTKARARDDG